MNPSDPAGPDAHEPWPTTFAGAKAMQLRLRERLVLRPPEGFAPRTIAGADVSANRFSKRGYAAVVVLDARTLQPVDAASAVVELRMPYVPGYLSFRELPALDEAWRKLRVRPDVLVFDGQGLAHPRRFGLACHGGVHFGVPAVGCAKTLLLGTHEPLGDERGASAALVHGGETVGAVLRTRTGVAPVYVSPGHRMDLATALSLVLALTPRFRLPETTRHAHQLVNDLRRADMATGEGGEAEADR
jgi:deoxyribonuclease V